MAVTFSAFCNSTTLSSSLAETLFFSLAFLFFTPFFFSLALESPLLSSFSFFPPEFSEDSVSDFDFDFDFDFDSDFDFEASLSMVLVASPFLSSFCVFFSSADSWYDQKHNYDTIWR